jgi:rhodanese-related sulfurtransferase
MIKLVIFSVFMVFFMSCSGTKETSVQSKDSEKTMYRKISAEQAYTMMSELENFIILDVRTQNEYKTQRIKGAILIPDYEIADRAEKELPDKNMVILVYCRGGNRSANASGILLSLGYKNIYDFGGIVNWHYETISG